MAVNTNEVTRSLKFFISLMMVFGVDSDGYITIDMPSRPTGDEDDNRLRLTDARKPVMVYQERLTDTSALVLNPYAEGTGNTPTTVWFYKGQRSALFGRLNEIFKTVIAIAIDEKKLAAEKGKKKDDTGARPAPQLMALASILAEHADDKMREEQDLLFKIEHADDLFTVVYKREQMSSSVRCALIDDIPWVESLTPKIRKRSIDLFAQLFRKLMDLGPTDDLSKFTAIAPPDAAPKLTSYLQALFNVYRQINPILSLIGEGRLTIDLTTYHEHLVKMPEYWANAKHAGQTVSRAPAVPPAQSQQAAQQVPGVTAIPTMAAAVPPLSNVPGATVVPGPLRADGTYGPGTIVPSIPAPMATMAPMQSYYPQQAGMVYQQPMMGMGMGMGGMPMQGGFGMQPMMQAAPLSGTAGLAMPQHTLQPGYFGMAPGQPAYWTGIMGA